MKPRHFAIVFLAMRAYAQGPDPQTAVVRTPAAVASGQTVPYQPLTTAGRMKWVFAGGLSGRTMAGYFVSGAIATGRNSPTEYGSQWDSYGKRVLERVEIGSMNRLAEASIGALWHEDPRFRPATGSPFRARLNNVVKSTFLARNRQGQFVPAYGRYVAMTSVSFASNAWRPDSQADTRSALLRLPIGFFGRFVSNALSEFWPEITRPLHRGK